VPTEGERLAALEQQIFDLRGDIADRKHEEERTRDRLHKIEGTLGMLVDVQKQARAQEARQYDRIKIWLQALTATIALAAFALSLTIGFTHHS
jgi:hypothetical protein